MLWWWCFIVMMVPAVALMFTEASPWPAKIGGVLLAASLLAMWLSSWRNLPIAILCLLPFMIFNGWQIVLLGLYGRNVIAVDMFLNLLTTNPDEVEELLGNLWIPVGIVILLYVPLLVTTVLMLTWHSRGIRVKGTRPAFVIGIVGIILTVPYCMQGKYRYERDFFPVNVCYNLGKAIHEHGKAAHSLQSSANFTFSAYTERTDTLPETYIVVIGETSRADRWQINGYSRPTNPYLSNRENIVSFTKVLSQSNTTHKSVPMLMTHLTSKNYGDSISMVKGLITAFAEAGYSTTFISNQRRNHSYIDRLGEEAAHSIFIRDTHPDGLPGGDLALIGVLDSTLQHDAHAKRLIVIHTYGSHFSYRDRYDTSQFTPDTYAAATSAGKTALNNAYDNTILMTDSLLNGFITLAEKQPGVSALLYTSDHGEDIFDDERQLFLHASPSPSFYQVHVPMIVWTSPKHQQEFPILTESLRRNTNAVLSSSAAFFPLALDLAGIITPFAPKGWSPARGLQPQEDIYYLTDLNESVSLVNSGFQHQDVELLQRLIHSPQH